MGPKAAGGQSSRGGVMTAVQSKLFGEIIGKEKKLARAGDQAKIDKLTETFGDADPVETLKSQHRSMVPEKSSQTYGFRLPIDNPKYGNERTRICADSFMDASHLGVRKAANDNTEAN